MINIHVTTKNLYQMQIQKKAHSKYNLYTLLCNNIPLQKWHEEIVKGLLDQLEHNFLHGLLDCSSDVVIDGGADTREKYKIYGLLLSACSMGKANPAAEGVAKEVS